MGIQMASALDRIFNTSRFPISGMARAIRGMAVCCREAKKPGCFWEDSGVNRQKHSTENRQAASSHTRCPVAASSTVMALPLSNRISAMRNTAAMRTICSAIWEAAGILAFFIP